MIGSSSNNLFEKIELYVSCRNLKDLDVFSKSDPYVKVSFKMDFTHKQYLSLGRTETVMNNLNPNFTKTFTLDYIFEARQEIKFQVYDDDNGNDEFIGEIQTTVGALMGAKSQTSILDLQSAGKITGKMVVRCQALSQSSQYFAMMFRAEKLMNTDSFFDFWDKSDPYLKFLKIREDNSLIEVARTQIIKDNLNPAWRSLEIQTFRLVSKNNQKFKIECWDWEEDGKDQFIGEIYLNASDLKSKLECPLTNPKSKNPGKLILDQFNLIKRPSFIDYLRGGLQLNMIVAIDFTGSNGTPTQPTSLHYMNPSKMNQYQLAINAITQILMHYDSDKRIPCFGFGGETRFQNLNKQGVNHCFPLSGNPAEVEAFGVEHLLSLYANALVHVNLSGPTYFGPIIEETMKLASVCQQQGSNTYQTLLILTDGEIHDMDESINKIVRGCILPISIIIVGVGGANFDNMSRLDGDNGLFNSKGQKAQRDIVQFVPFRDVQLNSDLLAKQLLAELPQQVVQYMTLINKPPGQYQQINVEQLVGPPKNINPMINLINNPNIIKFEE